MKATLGTHDTLTLTEAVAQYGISRGLLRQLVELGYLSKRPNNPTVQRSRLHLFPDEIDEYLRVSVMESDRKHLLAAMKTYRARAGRMKK